MTKHVQMKLQTVLQDDQCRTLSLVLHVKIPHKALIQRLQNNLPTHFSSIDDVFTLIRDFGNHVIKRVFIFNKAHHMRQLEYFVYIIEGLRKFYVVIMWVVDAQGFMHLIDLTGQDFYLVSF